MWPRGALDLAGRSAATLTQTGGSGYRTSGTPKFSPRRKGRGTMNVPKSIFRQYDVRGPGRPGAHARVRPGPGTRLCHRGRRAAGPGTGDRGGAGQPSVGRRAVSGRPAGHRRGGRNGHRRGHACRPRRSTSPSRRSAPMPELQVTGSHNPPEFNGFKMVLGGRGVSRRRHPRPVGDHHGRAVGIGRG